MFIDAPVTGAFLFLLRWEISPIKCGFHQNTLRLPTHKTPEGETGKPYLCRKISLHEFARIPG